MNVDPTIRTASPAAPPSHYQAYLNSPAWRARRNKKLKDVGYQCEKCTARRGLQVHHLTYVRLGAERDDDLEVLCENCHRDDHLENPDQTGLGLYLKVVSTLIRERRYVSVTDLADDTKRRCVKLKIPMNVERINSAIAVVCGNRLSDPRQIEHEHQYAGIPECDRPISHVEAREILGLLDFAQHVKTVAKPMPTIGKTPAEQKAHEVTLRGQIGRLQAAQYRAEHGRDRQPFEDRLEAIFGGHRA